MRSLPASVLLVVLASLALTACGKDEEVLDHNHIAAVIEEGIDDQLDLSMNVECPDDVEQRKGGKFKCTATSSDDKEFKVFATQQDAKGNVDWKADILPPGPIERSIAEEIFSKRAIRVTLDCPVAVPLEEDYKFTCEAEDDKGNTQDIKARLTDDEGNVTWSA